MKIWPCLLCCAIGAALLLAAPNALADAEAGTHQTDNAWAAKLLSQVREKYSKMSSFSAKLDCAADIAGVDPVRMNGEFSIAQGKWSVCLRRSAVESAAEPLMLLNVCNGAKLWHFDAAHKCIVQTEAAQVPASSAGAGFFPALEQYEPESLSILSRNDNSATLKIKPKSSSKPFFAFSSFDIDLKSMLISRMAFMDGAGHELLSIRFDSIEFDKPIPDSRFEFNGIDNLPVCTLKDIEAKPEDKK